MSTSKLFLLCTTIQWCFLKSNILEFHSPPLLLGFWGNLFQDSWRLDWARSHQNILHEQSVTKAWSVCKMHQNDSEKVKLKIEWKWCELRKCRFKWKRYDRRSGNCNLSNCTWGDANGFYWKYNPTQRYFLRGQLIRFKGTQSAMWPRWTGHYFCKLWKEFTSTRNQMNASATSRNPLQSFLVFHLILDLLQKTSFWANFNSSYDIIFIIYHIWGNKTKEIIF